MKSHDLQQENLRKLSSKQYTEKEIQRAFMEFKVSGKQYSEKEIQGVQTDS